MNHSPERLARIRPPDVIPEAVRLHQHWRSWFLVYAEYGDLRLGLMDDELSKQNPDIHGLGEDGRYTVGVGPVPCDAPEVCSGAAPGHARRYYRGDDLEEALNVFARLEREIALIASGITLDPDFRDPPRLTPEAQNCADGVG